MRYDIVPTTTLIAGPYEIKEFICPPPVSIILLHGYSSNNFNWVTNWVKISLILGMLNYKQNWL